MLSRSAPQSEQPAASVAPAGQEDVISEGIIKRFALSGASADAVQQLFDTPAGATAHAFAPDAGP